MDTFLLAMLAGLAVSAPPGPLGALCVSRTLRWGLGAGLGVAGSVALGDALLGSVAAVGAGAIGDVSPDARRIAAAVVALVLFGVGVRVLRRAGRPPATEPPRSGWRLGTGAFLLALCTPGTVPALLALFATFSIQQPAIAFAGVFLGGACWWLLLCLVAHRLRGRAQSVLLKVDYACGVFLWVGAGVAARTAIVA